MPKYWIGVIAADHAAMAATEEICAFSHGKKPAVAKLQAGDRVAYYAPRTGVREGDIVQAFVALATVEGNTPWQREWGDTGFVAWVRAATYDQGLHQTPVRPLLDRLSFVKDPRYWGIAFRRGQFEITESDFAAIQSAMRLQT